MLQLAPEFVQNALLLFLSLMDVEVDQSGYRPRINMEHLGYLCVRDVLVALELCYLIEILDESSGLGTFRLRHRM